jgi:nucleoside-diphosphate kinase
MAGNITFSMIKPAAFKNGHAGSILSIIQKAGFQIIAMKLTHLTRHQAEQFYAIHKGKPFFEELTDFMSSGPIVAFIVQKENAVGEYRKLIGATNLWKAEEGTIRKMFATSLTKNAVHGSDSDENAIIESSFFFSVFDRHYINEEEEIKE